MEDDEDVEESEDAGESAEDTEKTSYEIRLETLNTTKFIKLELLADKSFVMVEKFNALVNIYCKFSISSDAPPGTYHSSAIFGAYQIISPEEESRKGGKEISLTVEVAEHPLDSLGLLEVDFEAVKYFKGKQDNIQKEIDGLIIPKGRAFGSRYMYKYNLENFTMRRAEYETAQVQACNHLKQAAGQAAP